MYAFLLPLLFQRLGRLAPRVRIESTLARRRETTSELAAGKLDFAVDVPLNSDPQVRHVKLLEDRFVCAMRPGHPLAGAPLTLENYLGAGHIQISSRRNGLGYVDLALGKLGKQRRIALRSPHYLMAARVLLETNLILTVPERFARQHELHVAELPLADVPPLASHLYWHESTDQDPANRWMREQLIEIAEQIS